VSVILHIALATHGFPGPAHGVAADDLRVMTFNIRYGTANDGHHVWPNRRDLVMDRIRAARADIVGIQEALLFQIEELIGALPGFAVVGVGRADGICASEWSAILIRTSRFAVAQAQTHWLSPDPLIPGSVGWDAALPRTVTAALLVDRTAQRRLWVYNAHLDHRGTRAREGSTAIIRQLIQTQHPGIPTLVLGDFNTSPASKAMRTLLAAGPGWPGLIDSFLHRHPGASEIGTFNGFKNRRDGNKIDYVLCSRDLEITAAAIDRFRGPSGLHPSDHEPVTATLRYARGTP
jgi:endonuclease/exonuclease/phosphatase family metal-dependent hydrolase